MKKIYILIVGLMLTASVFAQVPEKMSYQAVVRNASNNLVTNTAVGMQISILQSSATGTAVYVETQTPTTNANGLVSLEIGTGTVVSGTFSTIDWANNTYFIKTETDPTGGANYTISGTTQLMSVPYALHAKTAESITGTVNYTETDPVYTASQAANITVSDITNLGNLSGTNTGDQDGSETKLTAGTNVSLTGTGTTADSYVINNPNSVLPTNANIGNLFYWDGTNWVILPASVNEGATLQMISGVPTWTGGTPLAIGDFRFGGVVFYIDGTGQHGFVCAVVDQYFGLVRWGCYGTSVPGADGTAMGTGFQNTVDIVATGCSWHGTAANLCANLTLYGYSDWFLPSKEELHRVYQFKDTINTTGATHGGVPFAQYSSYWSSSEKSGTNAWGIDFDYGGYFHDSKDGEYRVRAIRAF